MEENEGKKYNIVELSNFAGYARCRRLRLEIRRLDANALVLYRLAVCRAWWGNRDDCCDADDRHVPQQYNRVTALARSSLAKGWLAVLAGWLHQFEEYSLPVLGFDYSIQDMVCKNMGYPPYPDCPIPRLFLSGSEHRADVWGRCLLRIWVGAPARRPQPLGLDPPQRSRLRETNWVPARLQHGLLQKVCSVRSLVRLGDLRLRDSRAAQRQGGGLSIRCWNSRPYPPRHRLRASEDRSDQRHGSLGLCRRLCSVSRRSSSRVSGSRFVKADLLRPDATSAGKRAAAVAPSRGRP